MIGTLGDVIFEAFSELVRTFDGFERSGGAQYAEHARIGLKPLLQYVGPQLESVSFRMAFGAELGTRPLDEIERLRAMRDSGEAAVLILDGRPLARFVIESLAETWKRIDNKGGLIAAEVQVSLREYAEGTA